MTRHPLRAEELLERVDHRTIPARSIQLSADSTVSIGLRDLRFPVSVLSFRHIGNHHRKLANTTSR